MNSILEQPPAEVKENLELLKSDLDNKIPSKQLDRNLLIATWNIRAFGNLTRKWDSDDDDSPKRDLHSILCIAEIIKRFDVIAVQEVKDNIRALRDTLKVLGSNWSLILTDVNKGKVGNGERMAYLFDIRRVQLSGLAGELVVPEEWEDSIKDNALSNQFVRSPYAVSFKSGKRTFILVTLHILYGKNKKSRIPELRGIAKWLRDWADNVNAYHQDLVEYAQRKRVWIASPTTLMSFLTTVQVLLRNLERDKHAKIIQEELIKLSQEFGRYKDRWDKLSRTIETVTKDVKNIHISTEKIGKRFEEIAAVDIEEIQEIE